ncbi:facilitated trehalose transporter Tret1-like [Chrysoperla carnea]|uniref:facilitated trehalose transporter Tret1-like n=1 Tax=Chrysoperla carnea TaxID=189513 RepID=UPI001D09431E|nr:facilitated trehalose transporter Tret1-like [Chrysoperla carnea]
MGDVYLEHSQRTRSAKFKQYIACFAATIALFDDGLMYVWLSPVIPKLIAGDSGISITSEQESWLTSMLLIAAPITAIFSIQSIRLIGSKNLILLSNIPMILSLLLIIFSTSVIELYISRFLAGMCDAMCFVGAPAYIGEISEPSSRGILSTCIMISYNLGAVITLYFGYVLPLKTYPLYCLPAPFIMFILFLFMPQSPSYLVSKGKVEEAKKQLEVIRDSDICEEFADIKTSIENDVNVFANFLNLFRVRANIRATYIIFMTVFIWHCSGFIIMAIYLHTIILEAQIKLPETTSIVIYSLVQVLSGIASTFFVDRYGRKPLLYISCTGTAVCLCALGTFFFFKNMNYNVESVTILPLIALILYVFFVSIGLCNIPIVYTSELFAYNMKNYAGALFSLSYNLFGLGANYLFLVLTKHWGMHVLFWTLSVATLFGVLVTYIWLPETKNKSIIEIQNYLSSRKSKVSLRKSYVDLTGKS